MTARPFDTPEALLDTLGLYNKVSVLLVDSTRKGSINVPTNRKMEIAEWARLSDHTVVLYTSDTKRFLIYFAELCSKIEEFNVSVINQKLRISLGLRPAPVDTTKAQFKYVNPLCPWNDFVRHRSSKINH